MSINWLKFINNPQINICAFVDIFFLHSLMICSLFKD